jgi:23S rRNA pseudouridine2605 synthase
LEDPSAPGRKHFSVDGEKLQKWLARAGVGSRRQCESLIVAGRVTVNDNRAELGQRVGPQDRIRLDGLSLAQDPSREVWALYKPRGVLSTARDERGRPTVLDLVASKRRLFPVGRLDLDSEGLILLTDDGELANRLTHPRHHVPKLYRVQVDPVPSHSALERLRAGIELEDGLTSSCEVAHGQDGWLEFTLHEGRKRQIRRMLAAVGSTVERLLRVQVGPVALGTLACGQSRLLSAEEVSSLQRVAGISPRKLA